MSCCKNNLIDDFEMLKNNVLELLKNGHQLNFMFIPIGLMQHDKNKVWDLSNDINYSFSSLDMMKEKNL